MEPMVSIGTQDFETFRRNGLFYVDKTAFIREWWENEDAVTLITRPRRFGKTLNMSMVEQFFSNRYEGRGDLFEGLDIWKTSSYRELQGTRPVIFLSFANVKETDYLKTRKKICQILTNLYMEHRFLIEQDFLKDKDREFFESVSADMDDNAATMAVYQLSGYLYRYYGRKVILLLDEYDTPLQEAYANGFWNELTAFIRSFFGAAFKANPYMERGLMTGITRVSRESIFSDLNNLAVVTTTTERYADSFGFTEKEVFDALCRYGMEADMEKVREWYDGFTFGTQKDIYNPWSITCYLKERKLKPYWANTSSNKLAAQLIRQSSPEIKMAVEDLLQGRGLVAEIDEEIVFEQLSRREDAIWSLLLASGYLRAEKVWFDETIRRYMYRLALTNTEVLLTFEDMIDGWFRDGAVPYGSFLQALLHGDVGYMNEYMNQVAEDTFSSFDTGTKPSGRSNPERFYHGFVLGLIVELNGRYRITSNRESGFGRYDVMLEPLHRQDPAFILEFKVQNPRKETCLEETLRSALDQIREKGYDRELLARGVTAERIRHYGFAFAGKKVLIG